MCIPEALDDVVKAKSINNFKLSLFPSSLSVSSHADLIKFKATLTFHANKYFGCRGYGLNLPDQRDHTSIRQQAFHQHEHDK